MRQNREEERKRRWGKLDGKRKEETTQNGEREKHLTAR
jgi:hypothetical protein